jgi:hypothetical protein
MESLSARTMAGEEPKKGGGGRPLPACSDPSVRGVEPTDATPAPGEAEGRDRVWDCECLPRSCDCEMERRSTENGVLATWQGSITVTRIKSEAQ